MLLYRMIVPKIEEKILSIEKNRFKAKLFASLHQKATQSNPTE
jgi:hypothetical protein